ncbi:MAG: neutral/alkaline non-lysosomal ceramidase N-terminal domain-containing protein [Verrucomicrobiae bacterium]|nr:neutral/alkaline non-lysosomal ceramidase N-terminal domain-containing protein [Verrucomicrobiae bacterium]
MKRAAVIVVCVSLLAAAGEAVSALRAGAAAVDITPKLYPLSMPGMFTTRIAERAHDPLFARALVLSDDATTLAIVVVDNIGVAQETSDEAKALASKQCGIAVDKILVAATHTHTAPESNRKEGPKPAVEYRKQLIAGIAEAIVRAHAALRPAAVGAAVRPLPEEVSCRRWFLKPGKMPLNPFGQLDQVKMNPPSNPDVLDRPAGPTDPDLTILSVQDARTGNPLALLGNYSMHHVSGVPEGMLSADYFGEFARLLQERVGGKDFVAMMSNGACGDINNRDFTGKRPPRKPFEQIQIVGRKTADAAWQARESIAEHRSDARLGMIERQVTLKRRRPTPEQIEWARKVLAIKDEAERKKLPPLAEEYARRVLSLAKASETVTVPLQALRIGELGVCAIPFEAFAEIGLDIKKRSPFPRTMIIGIANAPSGYLPTPEQHKLGGYETWLGTCRVQEDASVIIVNHVVKMLRELKEATAGGATPR